MWIIVNATRYDIMTRFQEAALCLVDDFQLASLRYDLGEFLLEHLDEKRLDENIFLVVNLLDTDTSKSQHNIPKSIMLAELNLVAGRKAMSAAAFASAAVYLERDLDFLQSDHWNMHYKLSLELFSSAAEACYCVRKADKTQKFCEAVFTQTGQPLLKKMKAYYTSLVSIDSLCSPVGI